MLPLHETALSRLHNGDGIKPCVYDKHALIVEKWDVYNLLLLDAI